MFKTISVFTLLSLAFLAPQAHAAESICFVQPANAVPIPCLLDASNYPYVNGIISSISGTLGNNADANAVVATGLIGIDNYNNIFNGTTWDRLRGGASFPDSAAALLAPLSTGVQQTNALLGVYDVLQTGITRLTGQRTDNTTIAIGPEGLITLALNQIYDPVGLNYVRQYGDTTSGAWVNCKSGCAGGTFNNNADNVATSATNGQAAAFGYVWDGAAWDRLYGDQTNGAFVQIKNIPAFTCALCATASAQASQLTQETTTATQTTNTATSAASIATATGAVGDSAWVSGNGSVIAVLKGIFGKLGATLSVNTEGVKTTYSASITDLATAAAATDIVIINGSANKTIRITRVQASGTGTAITVPLKLIVRSTANSGSSSAVTAVPHDSGNAAATATVVSYTANPTPGSTVGEIRSGILNLNAASTATPQTPDVIWDFTTRNGQGIVLRGVAQGLAINFDATTVVTPKIGVNIEWTEE